MICASCLAQLNHTASNHGPQSDRRCKFIREQSFNDAYWKQRKYQAEVTGESLSLDHDSGTVSDVTGFENRSDLQRKLKPRHL